jgi:ferredoxin-NADP reductase/predicted pyridoxine 5'-phosphate oxidase superfamily flavin-nucleotide-binding protein
MAVSSAKSPFHQGEREIQTRLGVRDKIDAVGQRFIRDHIPDEHREFYAQLPFLMIGTIDKEGRPWASVLAGRPGFIHSPDPYTLEINTSPVCGDPLNDNLTKGAQVGLLGIEYRSRRRNRMTGRIAALNDGRIEIKVDQTFGNCPQYIQSRDFTLLPDIDKTGEVRPIQRLRHLDERARRIISQADNFYIATHYSDDPGDRTQGTDISHRGGKPGFVRIEGDQTMTYPDFVGNYHFNTLGNILLNPRAGLLFIDFDAGDLLFLTVTAEIVWDSAEKRAFDGAERLVSFTLDEGLLVESAMPIRWNFLDYSPSLDKTGSWEEVTEKITAQKEGNLYRNYRVVRMERESETITSFYLQPEDDDRISCHKAGQFLPIEVQPPSIDAPIQRTYTISNAPNGSYYRLSIKREPAARSDLPPGVVSSYFHDLVRPGTTIRALSPRGKFILDESSVRPVVFISGGVGVTPMISMLEQLANDCASCGCTRKVWFIHGARNGKEQAFGKYVRKLATDWPSLSVNFLYSRPSEGDVQGRNHDSVGRVDVELLKSLLPLDDYEFYLCGPLKFMESLYEGLKSLNIDDERIHYEFFGPGATLHQEHPSGFASLSKELADRTPVSVRFASSGIDAIWEPSKGTLLDLAEAEGLRPNYSCRSGICQTCSTRIVSGDVDYLEQPMTAPGERQALICCSYPRPDDDSEDDGLTLDL